MLIVYDPREKPLRQKLVQGSGLLLLRTEKAGFGNYGRLRNFGLRKLLNTISRL